MYAHIVYKICLRISFVYLYDKKYGQNTRTDMRKKGRVTARQ